MCDEPRHAALTHAPRKTFSRVVDGISVLIRGDHVVVGDRALIM